MKTVYLYDEKSGAYTHEYEAQESPLEEGEFIKPIHSLDVAPNLNPGLWPVAVDGVWTYVVDHRGVYYLPDGSEHFITDIGVSRPAGATVTVPDIGIRNAKVQQVNAERGRRWRGGTPLVIDGLTKWFHSDEFSLIQHLGLKDKARDLIAAGGAMSDVISIDGQAVLWSTMDGSQVTITVQIAFDLVAADGARQDQIMAVCRSHLLAIGIDATPADYDISVGWPAIFGEDFG
ncbi:hypothetical protein ACH50O_11585 [Methylomonas sp. 2BW1-5-20]|uniref:DUF4376 domain-containing protein n=1 Tax=Methylomonas sp. 2BW1-5-20 TaxID=3376686 RepID=UPI00404E961D